MARKGGRKGGSSAARSAAAKKGWETRRRGGAKAKPAATPKTLPKTTTARGRARTLETRARSAVKAGGGLRAARSLAIAQRARDWYKASGSGTRRSATKPRSGIRRTGGLPRPVAGNSIKRTTGPRRAPIAAKQNAVRTYRPPTRRGRAEQARRQLGRAERDVLNAASKLRDELKRTRPQRDAMMREVKQWQRRLSRRAARDIVNSAKPGIDGRIARISLSATPGNLQRAGMDVIRRRADRAAAAAARGSKAGARALGVYDRQLAPALPGKASKAKNNLKPGPRNTKGAPKKRRKRKG